jgi:chromosomal replication initiation ATPase DnaA
MLAAAERGMGLSEIGRALGRDHATVSYGIAAENARRAQR